MLVTSEEINVKKDVLHDLFQFASVLKSCDDHLLFWYFYILFTFLGKDDRLGGGVDLPSALLSKSDQVRLGREE